MSTGEQIIPVVNKQDEIIWYKPRKDITHDDIYRVAACRITDDEGNILLAQRAWTKKHNPGKRWPAVVWTVAQGETYQQNILHEIYEEIWLQVTSQDITLWFKSFFDHDWQYFWQWFFLTYTWPKDALQPEVWAVEQLRRCTKEELKTYLLTHPDEYSLSIHKLIELL